MEFKPEDFSYVPGYVFSDYTAERLADLANAKLRAWLDEFENLFLLGRNGMHRYNNQDHAMLTAMTAVENVKQGRTDKSNIWAVNTEQDPHEETN